MTQLEAELWTSREEVSKLKAYKVDDTEVRAIWQTPRIPLVRFFSKVVSLKLRCSTLQQLLDLNAELKTSYHGEKGRRVVEVQTDMVRN